MLHHPDFSQFVRFWSAASTFQFRVLQSNGQVPFKFRRIDSAGAHLSASTLSTDTYLHGRLTSLTFPTVRQKLVDLFSLFSFCCFGIHPNKSQVSLSRRFHYLGVFFHLSCMMALLFFGICFSASKSRTTNYNRSVIIYSVSDKTGDWVNRMHSQPVFLGPAVPVLNPMVIRNEVGKFVRNFDSFLVCRLHCKLLLLDYWTGTPSQTQGQLLSSLCQAIFAGGNADVWSFHQPFQRLTSKLCLCLVDKLVMSGRLLVSADPSCSVRYWKGWMREAVLHSDSPVLAKPTVLYPRFLNLCTHLCLPFGVTCWCRTSQLLSPCIFCLYIWLI